MPRQSRLGLAAFAAATIVALGLPVARDALMSAPVGAVLSARSASVAQPSSSPTAGDASSPSAPGATAPDGSDQPVPPLDPADAFRAAGLAANNDREARVGERWPTPLALLSGYRWPLPHGRVTNPFGPSWASDIVVNGVPFHDGLDIATFCGDRVLAAHDGTVIAAGRKVDPWMGWVGSLEPSVARRDRHGLWGSLPIVVVIDDGDGYRSLYAHFSQLVVHTGEHVRAGQFIGYEGMTGFATGCHVHFGLFSPLERATMALSPAVAKRTRLPALEIARIDPLLVLPPR